MKMLKGMLRLLLKLNIRVNLVISHLLQISHLIDETLVTNFESIIGGIFSITKKTMY